MNNHHGNISVHARSVIPTDALNYREARKQNKDVIYRNRCSQKWYLLNIRVPVPPSGHNETRFNSSCPWQESRVKNAGELSLNPLGV